MAKKLIRVTSALGALTIFATMFISNTEGKNSEVGYLANPKMDNIIKSYCLTASSFEAKLQQDAITLDTLSCLTPEQNLCAKIRKYATFFRIDPLLAETIAKYYTNDFSSEEYLKTFNIGPTVIGGEEKAFPNAEAGIIAYIRCLYQNPSLFDEAMQQIDLEIFYANALSIEQRNELLSVIEGKNSLTTELITTPEEKWEYEEPTLTQKQFMAYIAKVFDTDPYIATAVNYAEMGELRTDSGVPARNNYGNYRGSGDFYTYPTKEAGMIIHVISIMTKQGDLSVIDFVTTKSGAYVHGPNSGIKHDFTWEKNVLGCYKMISEEEQEAFVVPNDYELIDNNKEERKINRLTLS